MLVKTIFKNVLPLFFGVVACAQTTDKQEEDFLPRAYWGVSVAPVYVKKGHIEGDRNKYSLSSFPQLGGEILINRYYHIEPRYTFVLSIGADLLVHNFNYEIPQNLFDSVGGRAVTFNPAGPIKMSSGYFKAQAELQSKLYKNQQRGWFGAIGLSVIYPIQGGDEYSAGILWGSTSQSVQDYVLIQFQNYEHKASIDLHITGGYQWFLHKGNLLQVGLKLNYSPTDIASATYVFTVGHQPPVNGRYAISGSCIGLSIAYIFAKRKKH